MLRRRVETVLLLLVVAGCGGSGRGRGGRGPDGDADADADVDVDTDADADADADGDADADTDADVDADTDGDVDVPVDTDGDGFLDAEETACGADPGDELDTCFACDWARGDPGDVVATGAEVGDTIENLTLIDQCGEEVPLYTFAGEYRILWITAAW